MKTISLLANVLAQQAAVEADVHDAIFVKDGIALEGAHNNLFAVIDGVLRTAPASNNILGGITRGFVLERAAELGIPVQLRPILLEDLGGAEEVFFTGTTTEVKPTVSVDGKKIGDGQPGPIAKRLYQDLLDNIEALKH